ncbi:unnamed protein product [Gongylonema pulchrum]|uniref:Ion_trans_2 domain-containing protein n=1 Tax=Gongylonema pulchrum TaxID=637853 RepID=A0A183EDP9_9BILA|nr:unnamed protein product [Gongylonema pulchrum]
MDNALLLYDKKMGFLPDEDTPVKWTIWGGLYYAGTVFTTIGYLSTLCFCIEAIFDQYCPIACTVLIYKLRRADAGHVCCFIR